MTQARHPAPIRVGIGGWTFPPWRGGVFYPEKHPQARELEYAASILTALEIEGTYYRLATPASYAKWAAAAPPGFVYSVKASRYCTNRRVLADAGEGIATFLDSGLAELGDRLGPILWQFMVTKKFDPDDFGAFLKLLPANHKGLTLRHAVEPRHESFRDPAFIAMARAAGVAIVFADAKFPQIADLTGDFVYARLQAARENEPAGYPPAELDGWAETAEAWAAGEAPAGLTYADPAAKPPATPRDTFLFFINGAKERAPAAAQALIERVGRP